MKIKRKEYYVSVVASISRVLYVGFTDSLLLRTGQHRRGVYENTFSKKYKTYRLVYWEIFKNTDDAFQRERQLKKNRREKKINLIQQKNPKWIDYYYHLVKLYKQGIIFLMSQVWVG